MKRITTVLSATLLLVGMLAFGASAAPSDERKANCDVIGGVYDEGNDSSHNTATCTTTTTETVTSTTQVNNINAKHPVLRTTSTTITYQTVYAFTNSGQGSATTNPVDGEPEEGESVMVQCTPGSGYEACPED